MGVMQRVSSNLTLALVLFFPVLWAAFFTAFTIAIWAYRMDYYGSIPGPALRWGLSLFLAGGLTFFYFTVWRLKRVEVDDHFLYVTNFFKHVRYPWHQVEAVRIHDWKLFRTVTVALKQPGSFGKHIVFLPTGRVFEEFLREKEMWSQLVQ